MFRLVTVASDLTSGRIRLENGQYISKGGSLTLATKLNIALCVVVLIVDSALASHWIPSGHWGAVVATAISQIALAIGYTPARARNTLAELIEEPPKAPGP